MIASMVIALSIPCWITMCQPSTRQHTRFELYESGLPFEGGLAVASEGDLIYFASPATGDGDIYRFDFNGGAVERVAETDECDIEPVVSPNGSALAFCREFTNRSEVMLVDIGTGRSRSLPSPYTFNHPIGFTHDGRRVLVFQYELASNNRCVLIDIETNDEVEFPDLVSLGFDSVIGVAEHPDGGKWVAEWNYDGDLLRWVARGDRVVTVAGSSDLLLAKGSQWFMISDGEERELPISASGIFISKIGPIVGFWNVTSQEIGTFNVETDQLITKDAPQARVSRMSASETMMVLQVSGVLHRFDLESCELVPLVSVNEASVLIED